MKLLPEESLNLIEKNLKSEFLKELCFCSDLVLFHLAFLSNKRYHLINATFLHYFLFIFILCILLTLFLNNSWKWCSQASFIQFILIILLNILMLFIFPLGFIFIFWMNHSVLVLGWWITFYIFLVIYLLSVQLNWISLRCSRGDNLIFIKQTSLLNVLLIITFLF